MRAMQGLVISSAPFGLMIAGILFLPFSGLLSLPDGVVAFVGALLTWVLSIWIGRRYGRVAAYAFLLIVLFGGATVGPHWWPK